MIDTEHQGTRNRLQECVTDIGHILKRCDDLAEARRVIVAVGLAAGVFTISEDGRIITITEHDENVPRGTE